MFERVDAWAPEEGARRADDLFSRVWGGRPDGVWASPGRVNLIGEHLDYNAGLCLPLALEHATYAALRRRDDDRVNVVSGIAPDRPWSGVLTDVAPGVAAWVAYAAGPAWSLTQDGAELGGFDLAIESCVPLGAGLSSSAAIECAVALALDDAFGLGLAADDAGRARLARACVRAENDVAGAPTGGMDQATSLRASAGHALLLDFRDGAAAQLPLDLAASGLALLVIDTRAPHVLADGQYGRRRAACEAAAGRLGLSSLREVTDLDAALSALTDDWERRCVRHVVGEIGRVERVVELLRAGRVADIGPELDASHASLRDDYAVSCAELDAACEAARASGALGARMTGGGFGGSAIALVPVDRSDAVADAVARAFAASGFAAPQFLTASAAQGGRRVR